MNEILVVHGGSNKLRAKAAALLVSVNTDRFSSIIFSGGKIAGPDVPSEAETMQKVFLARIELLVPDIEKVRNKVSLEEKSYDTETNALQVLSALGNEGHEAKLILLSSFFHLPRIYSIYSRIGFSKLGIHSAEAVFYRTGKRRYKNYFRRYMVSQPILKAITLEVPLFFLTQFESGRKWIQTKTQSRV